MVSGGLGAHLEEARKGPKNRQRRADPNCVLQSAGVLAQVGPSSQLGSLLLRSKRESLLVSRCLGGVWGVHFANKSSSRDPGEVQGRG